MIRELIVLLCIDLPWIYLVMRPVYAHLVREIQGSPLVLNPLAAVVAYVSMAVVLRMMKEYHMTAYHSAILGMAIYAIYAWTVKAIFSEFTITAALLDTLWGGILFYFASHLVKK